MARIDPHITLVAPLNLRDDDLPGALALLRRAAAAAPARIEVTLGPVGTFAPTNPVLYLQVSGDLAALGALRERVHAAPLQRPSQWPWVPHVTVADDALHIPEALVALGAFALAVPAERIVLLEFEERRWEPLADVALGPPAVVGRGGLALELTESQLVDPDAAALLSAGGLPAAGGLPGGVVAPNLGPGRGRPPMVVTARRDGVVCGVAGAWMDDNGGHLAAFVPEGERRRGIGRHLVDALESAAARCGWENRTFAAHGPGEFNAAVSARAQVYSKATDA